MSDVEYSKYMVSATETLVVKDGAAKPTVLIEPELVLWDGTEQDLVTETWLRPELQTKKYNTKTAEVRVRPF